MCVWLSGKRDQLQNLCALCSSVVQQSRASGADAQTVSIQAQSLGYEVEHLQHEGRRGGCANGLLPDSVGYEVELLRVEGVRDGCANSRSQGPTIGWEVKQFEGWGGRGGCANCFCFQALKPGLLQGLAGSDYFELCALEHEVFVLCALRFTKHEVRRPRRMHHCSLDRSTSGWLRSHSRPSGHSSRS